MAVKRLDIIGSYLPILGEFGEDRRADDFRNVPASDKAAHDRGESYQDQGQLGGWASNGGRQFDQPTDRFAYAREGWGGDAEDFRRGYVTPRIDDHPAYQKNNYDLRSTENRTTSEDFGNTDLQSTDGEFRRRNTRSRGFLSRPRIPTER